MKFLYKLFYEKAYQAGYDASENYIDLLVQRVTLLNKYLTEKKGKLTTQALEIQKLNKCISNKNKVIYGLRIKIKQLQTLNKDTPKDTKIVKPRK